MKQLYAVIIEWPNGDAEVKGYGPNFDELKPLADATRRAVPRSCGVWVSPINADTATYVPPLHADTEARYRTGRAIA